MSATTTESPTTKPSAPAIDRIQKLIEQIEVISDPASRELMQKCIGSLLELYGDGLARIMAHLDSADPAVIEAFTKDDVIRALLLVHGLHPVPVEQRLKEALETVRPYMESHGGNIEVVSVEDGVATLRLEGHCKSCPSSTATMELAVRSAIEEACPDLDRIQVEDMAELSKNELHIPKAAPSWHILRKENLDKGAPRSIQVDGISVLLCGREGRRYAYRDRCPACDAPLIGGSLDGFMLSCPKGHRFDIRRAGASTEGPGFHLDPFPLVESDGIVKIAVR